LFKGLLFGSRLEIKCKKCAKLTYLSEFETEDPDDYYVIVFDKTGSVIDAGLSASIILGYTHEGMLKKKIFDIAPHITPENYRQVWDKLVKFGGDGFVIDGYQQTADGEKIFLRSKLRKFIHKDQVYVIELAEVMARNIESDVSYINCGGGSKNICPMEEMAEINMEGIYLYVSVGLTKALKYSRSKLLGTSLFEICDSSTRSSLKQDFDIMRMSYMPFMVAQNMFHTIEGRSVVFDLYFMPEYHPNNRLKGYKVLYITK
jgi:PAS domain S-box-containing protein